MQPRLPDGTLLDDAAGHRFVVAAEPELLDGLDAGGAYLPGDPAPLLEAHGGRAVVVRPDRYLLGVAASRDELAELLERLPERLFPALAEQRVEADGFDLRVVVGGSGPPLLALHGGGGLHVGDAHRLLARRHRLHALELPGFGASPENTRTRSLEELAGTTLAAADALRLHRFVLLGTSFGGAVALHLALAAPERVERLVLEFAGSPPRRRLAAARRSAARALPAP